MVDILQVAIFLTVLYCQGVISLEVDPLTFSQTKFDYIVVGGGTAGLALASRLSDDPLLCVGVIEAGIHRFDNKILVPGMIGSTLGDPDYDWLFFTEPQSRLGDRTIELGRGKVLGGTSALNFMAHTRASKAEYNGWETLGNPSWNFDSLQNFIKRSERWTPPQPIPEREFHANDDSGNHGVMGFIHTTSYTFYTDVVVPFFRTLNSLGIKTNEAANGGDTLGAWTITGVVDAQNRSRSYSTTAYYEPRETRPNLLLVTACQATRIRTAVDPIDPRLFRAVGVEYQTATGVQYTAVAKNEVILSAGAVGTPQLLELSGIGNQTLIESLGIQSIVDLPGVGENLQDHPGIVATFRTLDNLTTLDELNNAAFSAAQFSQYEQNRTGMFSSTTSTIALLRLDQFIEPERLQKMKEELDWALEGTTSHTAALQRSWIDDETVPQLEIILFPQLSSPIFEAIPGEKYYSLSFLFEHTWSRGKVHINSSEGTAAPQIDTQYLKALGNFDEHFFVEALKYGQKLVGTGSLQNITLQVLDPPLSSTDQSLRTYIRDRLTTNYHLIGTAAMLPREAGGVVDSTLKVYGLSNLRIVDASIFPLHIASHPTATLYGMVEKILDIITAA